MNRPTMATIALCRGALRRHAMPLTLSLSTGAFLVCRQRPMRLDAMPATSRSPSPTSSRVVNESDDWLNPQVIKELAGGSLAGENRITDEVSLVRWRNDEKV